MLFFHIKYIIIIFFVLLVVIASYILNIQDLALSLFMSRKDHFRKKNQPLLDRITKLEYKYEMYTDDELKEKFYSSSDIENSFAIIREAVKRTVRIRAYDVQILGAIALNEGCIAEMKTGEGKTLVIAMAAIYHARQKKGVHVVTVNDYLAKRDAGLIEPIARFFDLTVGYIIDSSSYEEKKDAYACDITYCSNNQVAFDYLRDNMVTSIEEKMQRELYIVIIDEVDNILIDEARTPLIISDTKKEDFSLYGILNEMIIPLVENTHYLLDHKNKNALFTSAGLIQIENELIHRDIINTRLFEYDNLHIYHILRNLLKAHKGLRAEVDYTVVKGEIVIIDEFTGRLARGRRFSHGLHQALEAKEGVEIKEGSVTKAWTSYTNFFRLYKKLSGMTGTAEIDSEEFMEIYNLQVIPIDTNKPVIRIDHKDIYLYKKYDNMIDDVIDLIEERHQKQQPILVCAANVRISQELSMKLDERNLSHNVLNAKNEELEAKIVAQAGRPNQITVSTNMAGRGTDIAIGGVIENAYDLTDEALEKAQYELAENRSIAFEAGGLLVIIVGAQDSRKSEVQFRGRSGRQGEPGESIIFYSLEDDILLSLYNDALNRMMIDYYFPSSQRFFTTKKAQELIRQIQETYQMHFFEMRKNQLKYDDVINDQRICTYQFRDQIMQLDVDGVRKILMNSINIYAKDNVIMDLMLEEVDKTQYNGLNDKEILIKLIDEKIKEHKEQLRVTILKTFDELWYVHIIEMDNLKSTIHLTSYEQKDPAQEYRIATFNLYKEMLSEFAVNMLLAVLSYHDHRQINFEDFFSSLPQGNMSDITSSIEDFLKQSDEFNYSLEDQELLANDDPSDSES